MFKTFLALTGAMVITLPAVAASADQAADVAPTVSAAVPVQDKKICRTDSTTGSMLGKRVCHTKGEWKAINDANEASARTSIDNFNRRRDMVPR